MDKLPLQNILRQLLCGAVFFASIGVLLPDKAMDFIEYVYVNDLDTFWLGCAFVMSLTVGTLIYHIEKNFYSYFIQLLLGWKKRVNSEKLDVEISYGVAKCELNSVHVAVIRSGEQATLGGVTVEKTRTCPSAFVLWLGIILAILNGFGIVLVICYGLKKEILWEKQPIVAIIMIIATCIGLLIPAIVFLFRFIKLGRIERFSLKRRFLKRWCLEHLYQKQGSLKRWFRKSWCLAHWFIALRLLKLKLIIRRLKKLWRTNLRLIEQIVSETRHLWLEESGENKDKANCVIMRRVANWSDFIHCGQCCAFAWMLGSFCVLVYCWRYDSDNVPFVRINLGLLCSLLLLSLELIADWHRYHHVLYVLNNNAKGKSDPTSNSQQ